MENGLNFMILRAAMIKWNRELDALGARLGKSVQEGQI